MTNWMDTWGTETISLDISYIISRSEPAAYEVLAMCCLAATVVLIYEAALTCREDLLYHSFQSVLRMSLT